MPRWTAVYLDYLDLQSARVWSWLRRLPHRDEVEVRPWMPDGARPWEPESRTWGLEVAALGELARETGREAHEAFCDEAFSILLSCGDPGAAGAECWLRLGAKADLDLLRFSRDSERWRAEVGLWQAEARDELGVERAPTLVFDDVHAVFVQLDDDVADADGAERLLVRVASFVSAGTGQGGRVEHRDR